MALAWTIGTRASPPRWSERVRRSSSIRISALDRLASRRKSSRRSITSPSRAESTSGRIQQRVAAAEADALGPRADACSAPGNGRRGSGVGGARWLPRVRPWRTKRAAPGSRANHVQPRRANGEAGPPRRVGPIRPPQGTIGQERADSGRLGLISFRTVEQLARSGPIWAPRPDFVPHRRTGGNRNAASAGACSIRSASSMRNPRGHGYSRAASRSPAASQAGPAGLSTRRSTIGSEMAFSRGGRARRRGSPARGSGTRHVRGRVAVDVGHPTRGHG